ncbi:methyltransferase domain-containing protein [Cylindrospermopsis raciborskii]|uniref:class I SAM-dependent methyltransferase n=1 Tax=Cylindrospermopsis raciborskii TaxID=77022 RepID=UPI0022BE5AD9|nr:methyltransferase domain-containing protein [Cylindrospermopsis raciborskii]MCZ2207541.1 methyltransferase domain-containing protein [Cylindrospermopsis raciborskii PAMP2011]
MTFTINSMYNRLVFLIARFLRFHGKHAFILRLNSKDSILDVGCGNNSPYKVKKILPLSYYVGIDIGDYNQLRPNLADQYILTNPKDFCSEIAKYKTYFDAVISSHNLEHCDDRMCTLKAMLESIKPGGKLYLSFPCETSLSFPRREGTLNYLDDTTHVPPPPDFELILQVISDYDFEILYQIRNYRPFFLALLGFLVEPISMLSKRVLRGTWEYYGFESIIWAVKR